MPPAAQPPEPSGPGCGCGSGQGHGPSCSPKLPEKKLAPAAPATPEPPVRPVDFVCEADVRAAIDGNRKIAIGPATIVTPSARDLAAASGVLIPVNK